MLFFLFFNSFNSFNNLSIYSGPSSLCDLILKHLIDCKSLMNAVIEFDQMSLTIRRKLCFKQCKNILILMNLN